MIVKNIASGFIIISLLCFSCGEKQEELVPANTPPNKPSASDGASYTCEVLRPTLSWNCSDPDYDDLYYTLKFGESASNLIEKASKLKTTNYTFTEELEKSKKYYWQIISSDGKDETLGDIWEFSTIGEPKVNKVPSTPTIISPITNTQSGNIDFIWSVSVDDGGIDNVFYVLNIRGVETEVTDATIKEMNVVAGVCEWYVTAVDQEGNAAESEHYIINIE